MNKWILATLALTLLFSCKSENNKENNGKDFFPVLSFLKSQVAHVDTSLYRITKITTVGERTDTSYIRREDFRKEAADFLSLPDITRKGLRDDYKQTEWYDESLKSVILSYMPTNEDAEIRRQEVVIEPNPEQGDKVKSIFIDQVKENGKSTVRKNLLWQADRSFRVVTITETPNGTEQIEKREVIWNDYSPAE